jgi:hypothetical protein
MRLCRKHAEDETAWEGVEGTVAKQGSCRVAIDSLCSCVDTLRRRDGVVGQV